MSDLKNEYRMPSMERITDVEKQNSVYELIDAAESEIVWGFVFFFFIHFSIEYTLNRE